MTATEIQKRNKKSEQLKVLETDDGQFFVESGEGKIMYNVVLGDKGNTCTCGDFAKNSKKDPNFNCKHILSVMNAIPTGNIENGKFLDKHRPRLDERFLTNIKGKDFVLYAGVLDLATQKGLLKLEVELLQFPSKENGHEAICRAVAVGKNAEVFSDVGDANPTNCHAMIAKHLIRMASTRAKGRALRDMCNIGIACLEELSDFDDVIGTGASKKAAPKRTTAKKSASPTKAPEKNDTETTEKSESPGETKPKAKAAAKAKPKAKKEAPKVEPETNDSEDQSDAPAMSEAQKRAVYNLSRRRGISVKELEKMSVEAYGVELESLSTTDASAFIRNLQQAA